MSLTIPLRRRCRTQALNSLCKTDPSDFTDWMSFLSSNLMEEIRPKTEALGANTFHQHGKDEKANNLGTNA